jgi:hypothetical protein
MINAERHLVEYVVRGQKTESEHTSTFLDEIFTIISNRISELLKPIFECLGNNNSEQIRTNAPLSTTHSVHQTEGTTTVTSNPIVNQPTTSSTSPLLAQAVAPEKVNTDDDASSSNSSDADEINTNIVSALPRPALTSLISDPREKGNGDGPPQDIETPSNVNNTQANQQPNTSPPLSENQAAIDSGNGFHYYPGTIDTSPPESMSESESQNIYVRNDFYNKGKTPPLSVNEADADAEKKSEIVGIGVIPASGKSVPSSQLLDNKISLDQVNSHEKIIISLELDNEDDVDKDEWLYDDAQSDVEEPEYSLNGVSTTVNQPFSTSSNQLLNNEADFDEVDDFISQVVYGESDNRSYEDNDTQSSIENSEHSLNTEEEAMRKLMLSEE